LRNAQKRNGDRHPLNSTVHIVYISYFFRNKGSTAKVVSLVNLRNLIHLIFESKRVILSVTSRNMKPIRFSGGLYSSEHSQRFKVGDTEIRFDRGFEKSIGFRLLI
jgi:hypothetical protein